MTNFHSSNLFLPYGPVPTSLHICALLVILLLFPEMPLKVPYIHVAPRSFSKITEILMLHFMEDIAIIHLLLSVFY